MSRWMASYAAALAVGLFAPAVGAFAAPPHKEIIANARHDTSAPMRDIVQHLPQRPPRGTEQEPYEIPNIFLKPPVKSQSDATVPNSPLVQTSPLGSSAPPIINSFDGINSVNSACGCLPPDTNGDVDDTYVFQWVNSRWALFDKLTGVVVPNGASNYTDGNSFWFGFGGFCELHNDGDPIVVWDAFAHRWVASQFISPDVGNTGAAQCVAVSTTSDPLGTYNRYEFDFPFFGDYPKMGVWVDESGTQDAYLLTTHDFDESQSPAPFAGASFALLERDKMLAGQTANMVRFTGNDAYGVEPVHLVGTTPAPKNACPMFVHFDSATSDYLFWDACLDWATPGNSTLSVQPTRVAPDAPFTYDYAQVPQLGTTAKLDSFGTHTMYHATARAFPAGGPERISLAINHTVLLDPVTTQSSVRWVHFGMNPPSDRIFGDGIDSSLLPDVNYLAPIGLAKSILAQGVYAPDANTRWLPGIAVDANDDLGIGYSVSSSTMNPQIRTTGRTLGDPSGALEDEQTCSPAGTGHQTSTSGRWGDYSSMSVDPSDQCTFYFTTEYYAATGSASWSTRVCSFKFPNCGTADFTIVNESAARTEMCLATGPGTLDYNLRVGVMNGFSGAVSFAVSGQGGATAQLSASTIDTTPGRNHLRLSNLAALGAGEHTIDVNGSSTAPPLARTTEISLGISTTAAVAPTLVAPANNAAGVKVVQDLTWNAVPGANKYLVQLATDAAFTHIVASATVTTTSWKTPSLTASTQYYWRVTSINYCGSGVASAAFTFTTGVPGTCPAGSTLTNVYSVDWNDNTAHGWTTSGSGATNWAIVASPNAGTGFAANSFVYFIPDNTTTSTRRLLSPAIVVPSGAQAVILSYDAFHNFEDDGPAACFDSLVLEAKPSTTTTFDYLGPERMFTDPYSGTDDYNALHKVWCKKTAGAQPGHSIVDLDSYAGQTIQLRFTASSDSNTAATAPNGAAIDNLKVDVCQ